jgi:hypothetical protein
MKKAIENLWVSKETKKRVEQLKLDLDLKTINEVVVYLLDNVK